MSDIPDTSAVDVAYVAVALEIAKLAVSGAGAYNNSGNASERTKLLTNEFLSALRAISAQKDIA